jgi:hypothetical protein
VRFYGNSSPLPAYLTPVLLCGDEWHQCILSVTYLRNFSLDLDNLKDTACRQIYPSVCPHKELLLAVRFIFFILKVVEETFLSTCQVLKMILWTFSKIDKNYWERRRLKILYHVT